MFAFGNERAFSSSLRNFENILRRNVTASNALEYRLSRRLYPQLLRNFVDIFAYLTNSFRL